MADIVTEVDSGKKYYCDLKTAKRSPENLVLGLFTNDAIVSGTTVIGDLTKMIEHGMTEKTLAGATWPSAAINGSAQGSSVYPDQDFMATVADAGTTTLVYGYYARTATGNELVYVCKYDPARPITNEGETITVSAEIREGQKAV